MCTIASITPDSQSADRVHNDHRQTKARRQSVSTTHMMHAAVSREQKTLMGAGGGVNPQPSRQSALEQIQTEWARSGCTLASGEIPHVVEFRIAHVAVDSDPGRGGTRASSSTVPCECIHTPSPFEHSSV